MVDMLLKHTIQQDNHTGYLSNESEFTIVHTYWTHVPDLPHGAHIIMGILGVLVYLFAISGNLAVLHLFCR